MRPRRSLLATLLSTCAALAPATARAQAPCPERASPPTAYQSRGDRCEGIYAQDVAGSASLRVRSLTARAEGLDAADRTPIHVQWFAPDPAAPVRVRALPLRQRLYYAMELTAAPRGGSYDWPTTVLAAAGVRPVDLGLVVTSRATLAGRAREVYLPAWASQRPTTPAPGGPYTLTIYPEVDVVEAFLTVRRLDAAGQLAATVVPTRKLGAFAAQARMPIALPPLPGPAFYQLQIGATLGDGAAATTVLLVYSPF